MTDTVGMAAFGHTCPAVQSTQPSPTGRIRDHHGLIVDQEPHAPGPSPSRPANPDTPKFRLLCCRLFISCAKGSP
eukprot:1158986-Pelagomonas_calceolata.AAC.5